MLSKKEGNGQAKRIEKRFQIVSLNQHKINPRTIAWFVNCHSSTVYRWISRTKTGDDSDLRDRNRCGRPSIYTEKTRLQTIAFYCQMNPLPGCNSWSLRWAEKYLKNHKEILGYSISHSTIQRILKSHALRPHLHKYFLEITDPDFFPKMDHIIDLYLNPPEYLFNFDECTSLQAKAPLAPDLPTAAGKSRYEEFAYSRNGTLDLLAFLNSKTGEVFGRCTSNHKTQTLVQVFKEHVAMQPPDVPLHYIMDNLNTHFNNEFCEAVAQLCGVTCHPLSTGAERRNWLQNENKRIFIHFVPFHGSWLNMIEIWFGILSKRCLKNKGFQSTLLLQKSIEEFIETWGNFFAHPFTWSYKGDKLHRSVVSRFNKLLMIESKQMDVKFLTKQLFLMSNVAKDYYKKVPVAVWTQLADLIVEKNDYIKNIINSSEKEKQKTKAQRAMQEFKDVLTETN